MTTKVTGSINQVLPVILDNKKFVQRTFYCLCLFLREMLLTFMSNDVRLILSKDIRQHI